MRPSEQEIEKEIKNCGFGLADMPEYIASLLDQHLEEHGDEKYNEGYEDGAEEYEFDFDSEEFQKECQKTNVDYAISVLLEIKQGVSFDDRLRELQFEKCRLM